MVRLILARFDPVPVVTEVEETCPEEHAALIIMYAGEYPEDFDVKITEGGRPGFKLAQIKRHVPFF